MTDPFVFTAGYAPLIFGLEWHALLDTSPAKAGRRLARQRRATHMALSGSAAASVGLAFLGGAQRRATGLHSAAQAVASMFPQGTYTLTLEVDAGVHWLVGVHEGAVIARTDVLHRDTALVRSLMTELAMAYPHLLELGSPNAPSAPTLADIESAVSSKTLLFKVRSARSLRVGFCLAFGLLLSALYGPFHNRHSTDTDRAGRDGQFSSGLTALHPSTASPDVRVHGETGLDGLLHVFYSLPVRADDWVLQYAACMDAVQSWQCTAHYHRAAHSASNAAFLRAIPSSWRVDFPSLELAHVHWSTQASTAPLHANILADKADNDRLLFSRLQAISKAFQRIDVGVSTPVVEQIREGGPQYQRRSLHIDGPLRSFSFLPPYAAGMAWTKAELRHQPIDRADARNSRFVFSLSGALYETTMPELASDEYASRPEFVAVPL